MSVTGYFGGIVFRIFLKVLAGYLFIEFIEINFPALSEEFF